MKMLRSLKKTKDKQYGEVPMPKVKYLLIRLKLRTVIHLNVMVKYVKENGESNNP